MSNRRLLIRASSTNVPAALSLGFRKFQLAPVFQRKETSSIWHVAETRHDFTDAEAWDLCHQIRHSGLGVAGACDIEFAEPDITQRWDINSPGDIAANAFQAAGLGCANPLLPDTGFPVPGAPTFDPLWFQGSAFSQLASAQPSGDPETRVRIAHLDTGYRAAGAFLPPSFDTANGTTFVPGEAPGSAVDPGVGGILRNPGHGTGTLGILAGKGVGGAQFAGVLPVRVANSVVEFANSSIAQGIDYAIQQGVHVLSMSMGGIPSQMWADVVNRAYEAGITLVTAAGNNFGPGPLRVPRFIVYPARFRRVIAACGVMADGKPYADFLNPAKMGGSYGPKSKMSTALAAYTPNVAWPDYDCPTRLDGNGAGTSAATPQIAAAAACWIQANMARWSAYSGWQRVEAVRAALFGTAAANVDVDHFGKGPVRAGAALGFPPPSVSSLVETQPDTVGVPFLGPLAGVVFGAARPKVEQQMFGVEAAQVFARNGEIQRILIANGVDPDQPAKDVPVSVRNQLVEALASDTSASKALKSAFKRTVLPNSPGVVVPDTIKPPALNPVPAESPEIPAPRVRKLRVFAFDPVLGLRVDTESLNQTTLEVLWEPDLQPGPVGEYLEVVDIDPASDTCFAPVDLNNPHLLASDGHAPSEGVPQFHQQMVYAVAMTTIRRFEEALGRSALWAPRLVRTGANRLTHLYVQRLRIYPHALREANAYYSPDKNALLFGYFQGNSTDAGDNLPGGLVFTCLSHDVVAHETTHALVDGLHPHYQTPSNPDAPAFHEAFADIVALFQHFSLPAALRHTIAENAGDLRNNNRLADLAQQFGQASYGTRALRNALGTPPSKSDYANAVEPHDKGAILLGAVFQAFLEIYEARIAPLKRLATGGTGVLPRGDIAFDLVNKMAEEAATAASHVLTTCIRALDYCPPVDITFGEYLRALITADLDVEPEDELNYRTAFISGFRARGIFPRGVRSLSEESLRWGAPRFQLPPEKLGRLLAGLDHTWGLCTDRRRAYIIGKKNGRALHEWVLGEGNLTTTEITGLGREFGVYWTDDAIKAAGKDLENCSVKRADDGSPKVEIQSVRPARRINRSGQQITDLVVEVLQRFDYVDPSNGVKSSHTGGGTILIDLERQRIRYTVLKRVGNSIRIQEERKRLGLAAEGSQSYFDEGATRETFAMQHRGL